jgi:hypothetical protein
MRFLMPLEQAVLQMGRELMLSYVLLQLEVSVTVEYFGC